MKLSDRFFSFLLYLSGVVFVAGVVHLVSILAMPELAPHDAYTRLSALAKPSEMTLLPRALPGHEIAPFEDPALAQAVCLYDLSNGPLHLHADLDHAEQLLDWRILEALGFYNAGLIERRQRTFYSEVLKASR